MSGRRRHADVPVRRGAVRSLVGEASLEFILVSMYHVNIERLLAGLANPHIISQIGRATRRWSGVHARLGQIVLLRDLFKTLFRSARLGRDECSRHEPGGHGMTFPGPRRHADDPRPCRHGLVRCMGRLFGSTVNRAPNIHIRWRPPSAHQAAAAAGRATGAPHRYHRSAPSQCSTA